MSKQSNSKGTTTRQRPSLKQLEHLYGFMENNLSFARGELSTVLMKSLCTQLTRELNSIRAEERLMENWRKTWHEAKTGAEQRYSMLQNGSDDVAPLTQTQLRILNIFGTRNMTRPVQSSANQVPSASSNQVFQVSSVSCTAVSDCSNKTSPPAIGNIISRESIINAINVANDEVPWSSSMNGLNIQDMGYLLDIKVPKLKRKTSNISYVDLTNEEPPHKKMKGVSGNMNVLLGAMHEQSDTLYQFLNGIITALQEMKEAILSLKELANPTTTQSQQPVFVDASVVEDLKEEEELKFINLDNFDVLKTL